MSSCCSTSSVFLATDSPKRHQCPINGKSYLQVPQSTILQHIKKPWHSEYSNLVEQAYYFCSDPECDVVYFGENNVVVDKSELRTLVGVKEPENQNALCCYCFDISYAEARKDSNLKQYVIEKTKNKHCSCESQNPSGRCCLKDFP